nr:hypothetical protein CFP56_69634 [Quercus suber]
MAFRLVAIIGKVVRKRAAAKSEVRFSVHRPTFSATTFLQLQESCTISESYALRTLKHHTLGAMAGSAKISKLPQGRTTSSKPTAAKASMKKSFLSEEMIVDSDDEDTTPQGKPTKPASMPSRSKAEPAKTSAISAKVNGTKRKVETLSSSSEPEDESESSESDSDEDDAERYAKKAKVVPEQQSPKEEADSTKRVSTTSGSTKRLSKLKSNSSDPPPVDPSTFASVPVKPFRPPSGFTALKPQAMMSSLLNETDLQGKQLWHICVPARVPFHSIGEISLDAINTNSTALEHKSIEYAWSEISDGDVSAVLLASKDGYTSSSQKIAKKLNLQQKINLPHLSTKQASQVTGSGAAADTARASVSSIRPQPKGLRMRYKPPGFGPGDPGIIGFESESEGQDDERSALQFPVTLGGASEEQTGMEGSGKRTSGKKKSGVMSNGVSNHSDAGIRHEEGSSVSAAKTPVMKVVAPEVGKSSMVDETKRKEAKRLRKEAKKAKRALS